MSFFISDALAEGGAAAAQAGGESGMLGFLPLILIFVLFYFMLIRPQSKRAKEHKQMVATLSKGDELVTNGGLLGRAVEIGDSFISLEIADGVVVKIQRHAIAAMLPKGSVKGTN